MSRRTSRGDVTPTNHVDLCACGCKYWTDDGRCFDCGDVFHPLVDDGPSPAEMRGDYGINGRDRNV